MIEAPAKPLTPTDPVERSIARPDAFAKPGTMGKAGFAKTATTRVRPLGWKRGPGRPRKRPFDKRQVRFY